MSATGGGDPCVGRRRRASSVYSAKSTQTQSIDRQMDQGHATVWVVSAHRMLGEAWTQVITALLGEPHITIRPVASVPELPASPTVTHSVVLFATREDQRRGHAAYRFYSSRWQDMHRQQSSSALVSLLCDDALDVTLNNLRTVLASMSQVPRDLKANEGTHGLPTTVRGIGR